MELQRKRERDLLHTEVLFFQFCVCQGLDFFTYPCTWYFGSSGIPLLYLVDVWVFSAFQAQSEAYTGSQWPTLILKVIFLFVFPKL